LKLLALETVNEGSALVEDHHIGLHQLSIDAQYIFLWRLGLLAVDRLIAPEIRRHQQESKGY